MNDIKLIVKGKMTKKQTATLYEATKILIYVQ